MGSDVELQIPLHFETFTAVLAGELVIVRVTSDVMGLEVVLRFRAIVAFVTAVQQAGVDLLVNQSVSLQVALVLERFVAGGAFEGSMEAVLAGDVTKDLALLLEHRLADVAGVGTVVEFLVQVVPLARVFLDIFVFAIVLGRFVVSGVERCSSIQRCFRR